MTEITRIQDIEKNMNEPTAKEIEILDDFFPTKSEHQSEHQTKPIKSILKKKEETPNSNSFRALNTLIIVILASCAFVLLQLSIFDKLFVKVKPQTLLIGKIITFSLILFLIIYLVGR